MENQNPEEVRTGRTRLAFKNEQSLDEFAVLCLQNGVPFAQGADLSISMQNRVFEELPSLVYAHFKFCEELGEVFTKAEPLPSGKRRVLTTEESREVLRKLVPEKFRPKE